MSWSEDEVLKAFGELTGIKFRFVAEEVKRQARRFSEHFTLQELELVVLWTKRQIARETGGFSQASLQWRVLMGTAYGDELVKFTERLGLAEEEMKRTGWRPPYVLCAAPKPAQPTLEKPEKPAPQEDVWEQGRAQFKAMQAQLFGPTFTRGDGS